MSFWRMNSPKNTVFIFIVTYSSCSLLRDNKLYLKKKVLLILRG